MATWRQLAEALAASAAAWDEDLGPDCDGSHRDALREGVRQVHEKAAGTFEWRHGDVERRGDGTIMLRVEGSSVGILACSDDTAYGPDGRRLFHEGDHVMVYARFVDGNYWSVRELHVQERL